MTKHGIHGYTVLTLNKGIRHYPIQLHNSLNWFLYIHLHLALINKLEQVKITRTYIKKKILRNKYHLVKTIEKRFLYETGQWKSLRASYFNLQALSWLISSLIYELLVKKLSFSKWRTENNWKNLKFKPEL